MKELLFQKIEEALRETKPFILAIDGPAGAGKSTLAKEIRCRYGGELIHMDDFFLPASLRSKNRLQEAGGNIHYERFEEEVLKGLKGNSGFSYQKFSCRTGSFTESCKLPPAAFYVIEGSYSLHPRFGAYYSLSVFLEVGSETQRERLINRSPEKWPDFRDRWIPMEQRYFESFQIREKADIRIRSL